ncbi:MAG: hypothetical protein IPP15_06115 [Saprospiraceae bacterium]|uniref:Uncharacterized protein n=1 Tax=Candidatus Opimibacter skivensis TaxID=2982028 RepID=A0A9D7STH4_9BACT|nr:hypothetical protein [Candidatus Opimibacter skivensis]
MRAVFAGTIALVYALFSCNTEKFPGPPIEKGYKCFIMQTWDEIKVRDSLIGKWQLEYVRCSGSTHGSYVTDEKYILEFRPDSTLTATYNDSIVYQTTRHINPGIERFLLNTDDFVDYTGGDIYLCEDFLIFAESQSDICDNYFRRIE